MRISKLFHWLYAGLMLAPLVAVGVKCLYVSFNKNAVESYSGNITENRYVDISSSLPQYDLYFTFNNQINLTGGSSNNAIYLTNIRYISGNLSSANINLVESSTSVKYWKDGSNYIRFSAFSSNLSGNTNVFTIQADVMGIQGSTATSNLWYKIYDLNGLDNVFYYSVDQVTSSDLFSWANNSFLVVPFRYIGNLFGVPNDNALYTFLSYWLDISIIWLVFDVVMYVPLLVHRWLDKGGIE